MPLPMQRLDNRTFDQLVAEAQALLPRLAPGWTDYNVHDPGITLIELFAWLVEMDFYRLDRISEASYRSFLRLVGVEPRPAQVAETVLMLSQNSPAGVATLPAGLQIGNEDATIIFQTIRKVHVSAAKLGAVLCGRDKALVDRSIENENKIGYQPFGAKPDPDSALYLGFDRELPQTPVKVSLYVWSTQWATDRETRRRLIEERRAAWRDSRAACPPSIKPQALRWWQHYSAHTTWEYYAATGQWEALADVTDRSRSLSLSGPVRFSIPSEPKLAKWRNDQYFIRCRLLSGRYECPPEIYRVALNAVPARNAADVETEERIDSIDGSAGQSFQLRHTPVVPASTNLRLLLRGVEDESWREVSSWDRVSAHDRAYKLSPESGEIAFGDGRVGRVAPTGAEIIVKYKIGGGPTGNVEARKLTRSLAGHPNLTISQPFAAIGGANAELLTAAQGRAIASLAKPRRAVTLGDFEELALATPGVPVAKAHAIADYDPALPCLPALGSVTVVVVPHCPEPRPEPGPHMLRAVAAYLERRRTLTTELHVIGPSYTTIAVHARLHIESNDDAQKLVERARSELDRFLHPLRGGPDGTGWPVGRDVYRAEVMALLNAFPHIAYVDEVALQVEGEMTGCYGRVNFLETIQLGDSALAVRARLHIERDAVAGELIERARVEIEKFFRSRAARLKHSSATTRNEYRDEVTALLRSVSGVTHVGEVSLQFGNEIGLVCQNVSICPHGLVATGNHQITVAHGEKIDSRRVTKRCCASHDRAKSNHGHVRGASDYE